jgi:hypothetical protein
MTRRSIAQVGPCTAHFQALGLFVMGSPPLRHHKEAISGLRDMSVHSCQIVRVRAVVLREFMVRRPSAMSPVATAPCCGICESFGRQYHVYVVCTRKVKEQPVDAGESQGLSNRRCRRLAADAKRYH